MPCKPSPVAIENVNISQDQQGRFCLNDLHRAAGGEDRHLPSLFMRRKETVEIIEALNLANPHGFPVEVVEGRNGGTYVCKTLVYDYAMWISAEFRLKVIRVFEATTTPQAALALPGDYLPALKALVASEEEKVRLAQVADEQQCQLVEQAPKVEAFERLLASGDSFTLQDTGRALGLPPNKFVARLIHDGLIFRVGGDVRAYAPWVTAGYFIHKLWASRNSTKSGLRARVTPQGLVWLRERYAAVPAQQSLLPAGGPTASL